MAVDETRDQQRSETNVANWVLDFLNAPDEFTESSPPDTGSEALASAPAPAKPQEYDGLDIYRKAIAQYPQANASENRALLKNWRDFASEEAMARLIEGNLHIVSRLANYYAYFYPEVEEQDLITAGYTGLKSAVEHFDSRKETPFNSYASFWVKQAMQRYIIKNMSVVYIPGQTRLLLQQLESYFVKNELAVEEFDELPSEHVEKIKKALNISERTLRTLFKLPLLNQIDLYSSFLLKNGRTTSLYDFCAQIPGENSIDLSETENKVLVAKLYEALSQLDPRESLVIKLRYGLFIEGKVLTLEEVSQRLGRTRERIRQIEQVAIQKLRPILQEAHDNHIKTRPPACNIAFSEYDLITVSKDELWHAVYDILDFAVIPLSMNEIRHKLKTSYPGHEVSNLLLKRILDSNVFSQTVLSNGTPVWQISENGITSKAGIGGQNEKNDTIAVTDDFLEKLDLMLEKTDDLDILHMGVFDLPEDDNVEVESISDSDSSADDIIKMFSM